MKPSDKDSSKGLGMFFSVALHVGVVVLILYWGFSGTSQYSSTPGPIQVSLSGLETGGEGNANQPPPVKKPLVKPKPPEPEKVQKKEEVKKEEPKKQEMEPPPEKKEPEKKEVVKEEKPKEKEKPKEEVVKKEPEKKEVIPLETEKEEKKEVAQKPKPTPKPKSKPTKKPAKKKDFDKERDRVLKDIQRQKVLDRLKKDKSDTEEPLEQLDEEIGEEQRLAMADDIKRGGEPESEGNAARSSSGGSSISPVIIQMYTNQVHRRISRNWTIPPSVPTDGGLSASVVFKVDGNGNVNNVRITESSGNSVFDNYCTQAINRSAPLPPPPAELAEEAKNKGIELTFRNES